MIEKPNNETQEADSRLLVESSKALSQVTCTDFHGCGICEGIPNGVIQLFAGSHLTSRAREVVREASSSKWRIAGR
jgi:hypothetical protein